MELFERNKKYTIKRKKEKKKKEMKKTFSPKLEQYTKKQEEQGETSPFYRRQGTIFLNYSLHFKEEISMSPDNHSSNTVFQQILSLWGNLKSSKAVLVSASATSLGSFASCLAMVRTTTGSATGSFRPL